MALVEEGLENNAPCKGLSDFLLQEKGLLLPLFQICRQVIETRICLHGGRSQKCHLLSGFYLLFLKKKKQKTLWLPLQEIHKPED